MVLFLKRYLMALSVVTVAMIAYGLTVARWIEPKSQVSFAIPSFTGLSSGNRWWEPIFASHDWQNQQPTVVQNSRGVLLAKSWQQVDQRTWKLTPLTIVLKQYDSEDDGLAPQEASPLVWVVNALEGATIHFDQPLDLNSGRVPSIQRGQLEGEICIHRVSLASPGKPTLELRTRNLSIDRRQIWTQDEVSMNTSDLQLRGRMLRIHLLGDILSQKELRSDGDDDSLYGPLDEIELVHLTESKMRLKSGGLWAGVPSGLLQLSQPISELPAHVEAQCGGRFSINFNKEIATLNGGVQLRHFLGSHPPDEFHCHRVQVKFEADGVSSMATEPPAHMPGLAIREIEAFGIDSLEDFVGEMWVEVKSPIANAYVRAKRVRYDFRNQRIELAGKLNQPGATMSIAELNYRGYHLRAPSLEYQAAPQDANGRPQHGGWMVAQGAGEVSTSADSPLGEAQIRWQDRLQWSPADRPGEQRLEIVGQTLVESRHRGFVTSDRLQFWLSNSTGAEQLQPDALRPERFQPKRLVTLGPTLIGVGNHQLQIESMDLSFVYPAKSALTADSELHLQDSSGNSMFQFLSPPANGPAATESLRGGGEERKGFRVAGRSLVASVAVAEQTWIDSMTLQGPLTIKSSDALAVQPIEIQGDSLVLASSPDGNVDLEIEGTPAKVSVADGSIEGPSIRFNQKQNHLWMDRPGTCTLPTRSLGGSQASGAASWPRPLSCSWQGRLLFNGKSILMDGGIRMHGAIQRGDDLWLMEGLCQTINIHLTETIDLQSGSPKIGMLGPGSDSSFHPIETSVVDSAPKQWTSPTAFGEMAQVSEIVFSDQVDLRIAQRDPLGHRQSLQRLQVPEVKVFVAEEKVVASGPGQGIAKFIATGSRGALAGSHSPSSEQLQCAHLTFRDSLTGLIGHHELVVDGNVKIVTSPIASWDQDFDPYAISRFTPGQMSLTSDQLKVMDTSSLNSTQPARLSSTSALNESFWEIQATGNVVFEGSSDTGDFSGNAYQVSYVQSKELLTLRGDGRTKAVLRRTPPIAPMVSSTNNYPTIIQVPVASLNVRTMAIVVPEGGLDVLVDFENGQGNNGTLRQEGIAPAPSANSGQPPSPRDSIKNFFQGYQTPAD